jgi:hypothetical protein
MSKGAEIIRRLPLVMRVWDERIDKGKPSDGKYYELEKKGRPNWVGKSSGNQ